MISCQILDIAYFHLYTQFSFCTDLSCDLLHLSGKYGQLINHVVDGVDQAQHLSREGYTSDFLHQISMSHGSLQNKIIMALSNIWHIV